MLLLLIEIIQESESIDSSKSDSEKFTTTRNPVRRNFMPIRTISVEADHFGLSNTLAAIINIATSVDYKSICLRDETNIIYHKKFDKAWRKIRKELFLQISSNEGIIRTFFYGRKKFFFFKLKEGNKWYKSVAVEDHYVLLAELGASYIALNSLKGVLKPQFQAHSFKI